MRDMETFSLPNLAEDFAAHALAHGIVAGKNALRGRHNGQTESAKDLRDLFFAAIDAPSGTGDALDAVNDRLAVIRVFEIEAKSRLRAFLDDLVIGNEALALEDLRHFHFEFRRRQLDTIVPRRNSIADSREHVGDRVCH